MFIHWKILQQNNFGQLETCMGFAKYETNICCLNSFQMDGGWRFNQSTVHFVLSNKEQELHLFA